MASFHASTLPNHLEGEGLSPVIELIPKGNGQIDLPEWHGLLLGYDAVERRSGWAEARPVCNTPGV